MAETIQMKADLSREKVDCGICYTALTRKRIVHLPCSHTFHRTCLLGVCESNGVIYRRFQCPLCDVLFGFDKVLDEKGAHLPEIFGFGPTGQPAESELVEVLQNPDQAYILEHIVTLTSSFLQQVLDHLAEARKVGNKSEEYVKDIVDERKKLTIRLRIMDEMVDNLDELNNRIRMAEGRDLLNRKKLTVKPSTLDARPENSDEPICGICIESLSRKRSVSLAPCAHKFHWTCFAKWINTKVTFTCCFCRAKVSQVIGENGENLREPFPMESRKDDLLRSGTYFSNAKLEHGRTVVTQMMQQRHQQRRLALRDGKSEEWIADIDDEMETLRKRSKALDEYHLAVTEIKAIEAAQAATDHDSNVDSDLESVDEEASEAHSSEDSDDDHRIPIGYIGEVPRRIEVYSDDERDVDSADQESTDAHGDLATEELRQTATDPIAAREASEAVEAEEAAAVVSATHGAADISRNGDEASENTMNRRRRANDDADAAAAVQQKRSRR